MKQTTVLDRREELEQPPKLERYSSLRRLATDPKKRLVISMGGGGVPSLAGSTALARLLEELGLREHVAEIWGTSAGAIVGGAWASGTKAQRILEILRSLGERRMVDIDWLHLAGGLFFRRFGGCLPDALLRGKHFYRAMRAGLSVANFEQCEIPFRCIACCDDTSGRRKVFREGELAPAISASMSLPGFLLPRGADGRPCVGYFDGGLVEKTPLYSPLADHTRLGDGRELMILGAYFGTHRNGEDGIPHGFVDRFLTTIDTMAEHLWEHQQREARRQSGVTVVMLDPAIEPDSVHFNFAQIDTYYLQARASFLEKLQNSRLALTLGSSCGPNHPCPA